MLTWSAVLGFATASFLITICPGPSWIYAITSAVRQNMTAGFVAVLGNGTGILCHITAAASGLAALLAVSPRLYATLQWAGVSYLAWLGFKMLWKGPAPLIASQAGRRRTLWQVYRGGMLVNVLNPKVSVLMLALMPQFVDPARGSTTVQTLLLGATHWVIATTVLAILVILASRGASTFRPTPLFSSATRWGAGIALLLFSLESGPVVALIVIRDLHLLRMREHLCFGHSCLIASFWPICSFYLVGKPEESDDIRATRR